MILHVACLPFPTYQGTQAAVAAMLQASVNTGQPTRVLTYARAAYELDAGYQVHRIPDFPNVRSLRSGPSWGKIGLDLRCVVEIRRLAEQLRPKVIIAHHIEAALATLAARAAPVYYVAHTSLARELPVYFPWLPQRLVEEFAKRIEHMVCSRAAGVAAVAPSLAQLLGERARYLPVPWTLPTALPPSRLEARAALGLAPQGRFCLYAGNLDRYQGWEHLVEALSLLRREERRTRLLLATESDPTPALELAQRVGVGDALDIRRLDGERTRQLVHAASDLAWIPRRTEGGLPIKMLDAFARELPVVAMERATAALPLRNACLTVTDDDPGALATAAKRLLEDDLAANAFRQQARQYLTTHHCATTYERSMRALLRDTDPTLTATRPAPRPRAVEAPRAR